MSNAALPSRSRWLRHMAWVCLPVLSTAGQVTMKLAAGALQTQPFGLGWMLAAAACPYVWMVLALEALNFIVWMDILKRHALGIAFPLSSIAYVSIVLASRWLFHEPIEALQMAGMTLILIGILLMGRSQSKNHY